MDDDGGDNAVEDGWDKDLPWADPAWELTQFVDETAAWCVCRHKDKSAQVSN